MQLLYKREAAQGMHMLSTLEHTHGGWARLCVGPPVAIVCSAVHNAVHTIGADVHVCSPNVGAPRPEPLRGVGSAARGHWHVRAADAPWPLVLQGTDSAVKRRLHLRTAGTS